MRRLISKIAMLSVPAILITATPVVAWNPFSRACTTGDGTQGSIACETSNKPANDPFTGANSVIARATDLIAMITGVAAVIAIMVGGIRFITASGDPQGINAAKNTILYALIGLVVIVIARTVVLYVLRRL